MLGASFKETLVAVEGYPFAPSSATRDGLSACYFTSTLVTSQVAAASVVLV